MINKVDIIVVYFSTDFMIKKYVSQLLKTKYDNYNIYIIDNTLKSKKKLKLFFNSNKVYIKDGVNPLWRGEKRDEYQRGRHHPEGVEVGIEKHLQNI